MSSAPSEIVVTGIAAVSAAGVGTDRLRELLETGATALTPIPEAVVGEAGHLWGKATDFRAADFMPPLKARKFDRGSLFAVAAAGLALKDAGVIPRAGDPTRVGIALGCGFGGISNSEGFLRGYFGSGADGAVPMLFPNTVPNAPASNASIEHGCQGPNVTQVQRFCSAEAAFQMACRFLEEGRADVMLTGGVDELSEVVIRGFHSTGQLRRWGRDFGEGCGMLVLERRDSALRRGARIHAGIGALSSIGQFLPGREQEAVTRLLGDCRPDLLSVSGVTPHRELLLERFRGVATLEIAPLLGRSLALGGLALVALVLSLRAGMQGLHLGASPEGPYFAIEVTGGDSVQS